MFKVAAVETLGDRMAAEAIMKRIVAENPSHWPYGLDSNNFDGGLYLIREKRSHVPVGFCGWQVRHEFEPVKQASMIRVGYYSIGILPEYRNNGLAKAAVARLINFKAASVDKIKAMIVAGNVPSVALANSLQVPVMLKAASVQASMSYASSVSLYDALRRIGVGRFAS